MTAVEWLIEQISEKQPNGFYVIDTLEDVKRVFEHAKATEKEQIIDSHIEGQRVFDKHPHTQWTNDQAEQYYNETFNK